jgi:thiamine kinase-like enzyme
MLAIPTTAESITASWLSEVLNIPVASCEVSDSNSGTTGRAVLTLKYDASGSGPSRLFVKLPPTDDQQKAFVQATGMGKREAQFYQTLSGEVPVRIPKCYYSASDASGDNYIMLLEHLEDSGCSFRALSQHYSLGYVRAVLAAFAQLHAKYWQSPLFATTLSWLEPPLQYDFTKTLVSRALQQHSSTMPPVFTDMGELYMAHTDQVHRLWNEGTPTFIHGDVHDGNMFLDGEQPGFLDWALLAKGPGMRDVGYFLAGALSDFDQKSHSRELLSYYRDELSRHGVAAPPLEELWRQYQWHAAYVWVGAAVTLSMGDAWQPVDYVTATLERLHSALEELDSVAALRTAIDQQAQL